MNICRIRHSRSTEVRYSKSESAAFFLTGLPVFLCDYLFPDWFSISPTAYYIIFRLFVHTNNIFIQQGIQWVPRDSNVIPKPPKSKLLLIITRWQLYCLARLIGKFVRFQHRGTHWWAAPLYRTGLGYTTDSTALPRGLRQISICVCF